MRRLAFVVLAVVCAGGCGMRPMQAEESRQEEATAGEQHAVVAEQPKPEELLRQMADYYADLPAFSTRVNLLVSIQGAGMDHRMDQNVTLSLERPNRFSMVVDSEDMMGMTMISDGKQLWQYMPDFNRYTVQDAPEDFSDLASGDGASGFAMMGAAGPMIPTSGEEFYNSLIEGVTESEYVGEETVGDAVCHRCRFMRDDVDWDIWIEAGDRPLVHKIVPDLSKQFAAAGEMFKDAKIEYSVVFTDWNVAPEFTDADFAFVPPADAEEVESLFEGLAGGQDEGPHPLLGEPAPHFATVNLENEEIDLASHLGQDVVILDFWATWCGPCVAALPTLAEVADKYQDRGVVFYAVNLREDAETIKEFLTSQELDIPVAMDSEGTTGRLYHVSGIPQTVLIGKDGKVQVVHIGFGADLGERLTDEIEALLEGKDLAGKALAEPTDSP